MKKTFMVECEYDEDQSTIPATFGMTREQIDAVYDKAVDIVEKLKGNASPTSILMQLLDENAIPGGVAMTILASHLGMKIKKTMVERMMSRSGVGGILGLLGKVVGANGESSVLADLLGAGLAEGHDCASCTGYDECTLPFKTPRDGSAG